MKREGNTIVIEEEDITDSGYSDWDNPKQRPEIIRPIPESYEMKTMVDDTKYCTIPNELTPGDKNDEYFYNTWCKNCDGQGWVEKRKSRCIHYKPAE